MKVTLCDETPGGPPFERAKGKPDMFIPNVSIEAFRRGDPMAGDPIATVVVPVKTVSELNRHEHWRLRQRRAKAQHEVTTFAIRSRISHFSTTNAEPSWWLVARCHPCHVHLTRLSGRKLDSDNLQGALKHVRDAVAKFLGVDDGDEAKVTFSYAQEKAKGFNVRIEFYRRAE